MLNPKRHPSAVFACLALTVGLIGSHQYLSHPKLSLLLAPAAVAQGNDKATADRLLGQGDKTPFGDPEARLQPYQDALKIYQRLNEPRGEQEALYRIGGAYYSLGNLDQAQTNLEQAIEISQNSPDPSTKAFAASIHRVLGHVYIDQGQPLKAVAGFKLVLQEAKSRQESSPVYDRSTSAYSVALALTDLGKAYIAAKDYRQALQHLQQGLQLGQQGNPSGTPDASTAAFLGLSYFKTGDLKAAETTFLQAIKLEELGGSESDLKIGQDIEQATQKALQQFEAVYGKNSPQAKQLAEQLKKYSTAASQNLRENGANVDLASIRPAESISCSLLQQLYADQNQASTALEISERCRGAALARRLATTVNPEAASRSVSPPNVQQISQIAKDQQTTLVQYSIVADDVPLQGKRSLSESNLLIWVIQPSGKITFRKIDLKDWTATGQSLSDLVAQTRQAIGVRGRASIVARRTNDPNSPQDNGALKKLHQLLIEPIADVLPNDPNAHVTFIPQGALLSVPFPALTDASGKYLVDQHTLRTAPSVQALAFTQRRLQQVKQQGNKQVLVVGNPTMPQYSPDPKQPKQQLPALPGAESEAKQIAALYKTKPLLGSQASETAIVPQLSQARIVHFATHGLLDAPSNSSLQSLLPLLDPTGNRLRTPGAIALAPAGGQDGLLTSDEIAKLNLNTDLVVLSACDTGNGAILADGVVGLSRSLLVAGAPSVLASLWKVPDQATADLMVAFYQQLQSNPDKAQALRQAMLKVRQQYPNPVDWAAFTLIGEAG